MYTFYGIFGSILSQDSSAHAFACTNCFMTFPLTLKDNSSGFGKQERTM